MNKLAEQFKKDVKARYMQKLADYDPDKDYGHLKADDIQIPETTWFENLANSAPVSNALDTYDTVSDKVLDFIDNTVPESLDTGIRNIVDAVGNGAYNTIDNIDSLQDMAGIAMHELLPDPALSRANKSIDEEYAYQRSPRFYAQRYNNIMQNFKDMQGTVSHTLNNHPWIYSLLLGSKDPREQRLNLVTEAVNEAKRGGHHAQEAKALLSDMDLYDYFNENDKIRSVKARDNIMALAGL